MCQYFFIPTLQASIINSLQLFEHWNDQSDLLWREDDHEQSKKVIPPNLLKNQRQLQIDSSYS